LKNVDEKGRRLGERKRSPRRRRMALASLAPMLAQADRSIQASAAADR
jgi:hypothetical protein